METVSLIIPVYNGEKHLHTCLESVLAQIYDQLEIVIVDDGSQDGSWGICEEYARQDPRFKVIHQENRGVSAARKAGIEASTGAYLCFVDSDDVLNPHFVEYLKRAMDEHGADIAYCGLYMFQDGDEDRPEAGEYEQQEIISCTKEEAFDQLFSIWYLPNMCNKLFKREVIAKVKFPDHVRAEDLYVSNYALSEAAVIVGLKKCRLYYYRQYPDSAMCRITPKVIDGDCRLRLDVFVNLYLGKHPVTAEKFARQTWRMFLGLTLTSYRWKLKDCQKALKKYNKELCKQMLFKTDRTVGERLDYALLYCSVPLWGLLQIFKHKVFKIPLYRN